MKNQIGRDSRNFIEDLLNGNNQYEIRITGKINSGLHEQRAAIIYRQGETVGFILGNKVIDVNENRIAILLQPNKLSWSKIYIYSPDWKQIGHIKGFFLDKLYNGKGKIVLERSKLLSKIRECVEVYH